MTLVNRDTRHVVECDIGKYRDNNHVVECDTGKYRDNHVVECDLVNIEIIIML